MQFAMLSEIHRIVDEGLASAEDVDAAIRLSLGPRWALWGALGCEDLVVNKKTAVATMEYLREQTGQDYYQPTKALLGLVEQGRLGTIAGAGWHRWEAPYAEIVMDRDQQLADILAWLSERKGPSLDARPEPL
jgi:3-hydroxybutyryl-CoA dehydrogenase